MMTKLKMIRTAARTLKDRWNNRSNAAIFERIYKEKHWGSPPDGTGTFYSGVGSYDPCIPDYVSAVQGVIRDYNVKSVVEIGCGDFAVASKYVHDCVVYTGIDVVKSLVVFNSRRFATEKCRFVCADATRSIIPHADLCIVRQVLQHLSNDEIIQVIQNIRSPLILITEHLPSPSKTTAYNADIKTGGGVRVPLGSGVFIDQPPFNLRSKVVLERNVISNIHAADERLVTWLVNAA